MIAMPNYNTPSMSITHDAMALVVAFVGIVGSPNNAIGDDSQSCWVNYGWHISCNTCIFFGFLCIQKGFGAMFRLKNAILSL